MLVAVSKIAALRQKLLLLQATYVASPNRQYRLLLPLKQISWVIAS
jgi:hypothetical protein